MGHKRKTADFRLKSHFAWRSLLQSFCVWKLSATKLEGIH